MQFARNMLIIALLLVGYYLLRIHWILRDNGVTNDYFQWRQNHRRFCQLIAAESEPVLKASYQRLLNGLYFSLITLILAVLFSL